MHLLVTHTSRVRAHELGEQCLVTLIVSHGWFVASCRTYHIATLLLRVLFLLDWNIILGGHKRTIAFLVSVVK